MKIALGFQIQDGPWGGGNRFARSLSEALVGSSHEVVTTLRDDDIDIALMMDPRFRHPAATFTAPSLALYRAMRDSGLLIVHRINECDERKGTKSMNSLLKRANYIADHTVFVGDWLRRLDLWQDSPRASWSTIHNGADTSIFNTSGWKPWSGEGPLKLVTHHWGGNWMKGFDVYQEIDRMLGEPEWKPVIEFTYIGNLPRGFTFKHARHAAPLDADDLADEIRRHHLYVTASINEPGGNHQNEGALCGLPLLYRNSGCMPEYCEGFGLRFEGADDFRRVLKNYLDHGTYTSYVNRMPAYPHTADATAKAYIDLFEDLHGRRGELIENRRRRHNLRKAVAAMWPF